jgi:hypothetical protein
LKLKAEEEAKEAKRLADIRRVQEEEDARRKEQEEAAAAEKQR